MLFPRFPFLGTPPVSKHHVTYVTVTEKKRISAELLTQTQQE